MSPNPWPAREDLTRDNRRHGLRFARRLMLFLAISNGLMVAGFLAIAHPMVIGSAAVSVACGYLATHLGDELAR
jgi:hypothetical protein